MKCLKVFKKNRGEAKDIDDLRLIDAFLNQNKNRRKEKIKIIFVRYKRRIITNAQGLVIRFTHKTGTYDLVRNLYHKVKNKNGEKDTLYYE